MATLANQVLEKSTGDRSARSGAGDMSTGTGTGNDISNEEWELRNKLASCYRLFDHLGWIELIFNHITLRVPGPEHHFLINPFGLMYSEVTAANLVKIDLKGNVLQDTPWDVNPAGFVIHSAIHEARDDAHCVMHTHTTTGSAVSCKENGLENSNFYTAMASQDVAYHDFEGTTTNEGEKERLVASLGSANLLILRNHGLLSCGATVEDAFFSLWRLQRACDVQAMSRAMSGPDIPVNEASVEQSLRAGTFVSKDGRTTSEMVFDAMIRIVDGKDDSYRHRG